MLTDTIRRQAHFVSSALFYAVAHADCLAGDERKEMEHGIMEATRIIVAVGQGIEIAESLDRTIVLNSVLDNALLSANSLMLRVYELQSGANDSPLRDDLMEQLHGTALCIIQGINQAKGLSLTRCIYCDCDRETLGHEHYEVHSPECANHG